jgi:hypothetical protein
MTRDGPTMFTHACLLGCEGIVSKRNSRYRSGRSREWLKMKNPNAPAVKREAEEDWDGDRPPTPTSSSEFLTDLGPMPRVFLS